MTSGSSRMGTLARFAAHPPLRDPTPWASATKAARAADCIVLRAVIQGPAGFPLQRRPRAPRPFKKPVGFETASFGGCSTPRVNVDLLDAQAVQIAAAHAHRRAR